MPRELVGGVDRRDFLKTMGLALVSIGVPAHMQKMATNHPEEFVRLEKVENMGDVLVEVIRGLCRAQVEWWQQVPALALEADGRSGYSGIYQIAYSQRLWELDPEERWGFCVDLETGELVKRFYEWKNGRPALAESEEVLGLTYDLELLDAQALVNGLREDAVAEVKLYSTRDAEELEAWRAEQRERYGLERPKWDGMGE